MLKKAELAFGQDDSTRYTWKHKQIRYAIPIGNVRNIHYLVLIRSTKQVHANIWLDKIHMNFVDDIGNIFPKGENN